MASNNSYKGITVKFGADTTELGKALKDIDQQAKGVSADIKEIDKGLKIDPKNVDLTIQKINKLGEGIQTATTRLNVLKQAQAEARQAMENGAEGAEQRYKDLQREIQKTENEIAKLKKQAKETADAMKRDLSEAVDKFEGQVKKLAATVTAIVAALGGITASAAKSADEINTLSKVTGISTEELQKFQYASALVDVSTETLQSSLTKLTRSMSGASDETGSAYEAFRALGIEIKTANGDLRSNTDVFYEVIDALGEIDNATQRDALSMQIFGRSAQDLNPLIIAGSEALKQYGDEAEQMGLVFDQVTLDKLNEFQDKIDVSKQQLKGMATIVGGELIDSFNSLFNGADGLLKKAQEAKENGTLKEIADGVASAVTTLIDILAAAAKFVYEFRDAIVAGTVALIAYKAVMGISNIVTALVNAIKAFTAAQKAATAAQEGFNAAAALNPYALIAAAAAAAMIAIGKFVAAQYEANAAYGNFFDAVEEDLKKTSDAAKSYDELREKIESNQKAREKTVADIEGEYYGYEKLVARLYELNDIQDKTKDNRAEMEEIVSKLEGSVSGLSIAYDKETGALKTQRAEIEQAIQATKELAIAKAAAKQQESIAADIAAVELDKNKLSREIDEIYKERKQLAEEALKKYGIETDGDSLSALRLLRKNTSSNYDAEKRADLDDTIKKLEELDAKQAQLTVRENDAQNKLEDLNKSYDMNAEAIAKKSDELDAEEKAAQAAAAAEAELAKATEEATAATEEAAKAYEEANSKAAEYRGQLDDLISVYQKVSAGTHYSASQMSALIEKYPELAQHIRHTADGYEIEAAAVKELIDQKAQLMLAEKQEAAEQARLAYEQASKEYGNKRAISSGSDADFAEEKKKVDEARQLWENAKSAAEAYAMVIQDYQQNSFDTSSTSGTVADRWKQAAESEIAEAEHLYKMGEISAEEYYKRLADINRRYYANRAQYIEEYRKLEETVYSGMKKQEEEQLSNMKSLLDRIEAVKNAQRELENAQNQKKVVYSSAAGFRTEQDAAAIDKASTTLQSKQLELASLLQQKYGANISIPQISAADLSGLLPDLSGIRIPSSTATQTKQVTVNYTAGDVIINGSADSGTVDRLKALMNSESKKFFEQYLADYLDRADMDRQTGG